ncbi:MAG: DNA polymerase I [Candidatus Neomarinimicrobiota bacterium]
MSLSKTIRKRFFIIDGYALLYRAHFALIRNPLITTYGLNTSALFGFVNHILKLTRDENPDYFVCAFDSKGKTFRHDMYEEYKANRPEMPKELQLQLPHLWEILEAMNIPVLKKNGVEADDIIGTLAVNAQKDGLDTYIVSGDKDFMQLINENIFLYAPGTKKAPYPIIYDSEKVKEKWGVPPDKIIDLLGLMGDSSDNVPGVAGVGEKTAVKLIKEYGSLKGALENADKVANKRARTGLLDGYNKAVLSRNLVTIMLDVDINYEIQDFKKQLMNNESCLIKFRELEFQAFVKQFESNSSSLKENLEISKKNYSIISNIDQLDQLIIDLKKAQLIAFNLETTSQIPFQADIVGISFSISSNSGWYIPIMYLEKEKNHFGDNDLNIVMDRIKDVFDNQSILKTGHNIKFDMHVLKRQGVDVQGIVFDTKVVSHLLNPSARSISLDNLSLEYLNYEMMKIDELIGRGKNQLLFSEVSIKQASFYVTENADVILQLTSILEKRLKENSLYDFFNSIELNLIPVLTQMEYFGVYVDLKMLESMSIETGAKIDDLKKSIYFNSGKEFNINSTQQLANILFDDLELPQIKKRSTAEEVLKRLRDYHNLPDFILDYRKYYKLKNTYLDSLRELVNEQTNRIHSTFNQTIASTGRLSSTNPNFQNIPIRTNEGREIRKSFVSQKDGWKILSADYSQIELRIMAHFSQDKGLIDAFNDSEDIHSKTASKVFNVPIEMVIPEMRRTAKVVNFGIMYGAGAFRISQELGIPRKEAVSLIKNYFQQYPGIQNYIDSTCLKAREDKYVETILGRKRPIWEADSDNALRRKAAERMAINMPIQGSAAEMIKLAMINIHQGIKEMCLKAKLVLQIHDELIFEFPVEEQEELVKLVIEKMENALHLTVPVKVDYGIGNSWYEAH